MSPKNAIKIINIQNSYSIHTGFIWSTLSTKIIFDQFSFIQSKLVQFCPLQSYSVHIGPIQFILSILVHLSPIQSILSTSAFSFHIGPIRSIMSTLVLIYSVLFGVLLVPFSPIWSNLVHFDPLGSFFVHLHNKKIYVWVESTYFKSKFINCNMGNIYFCKHHWIIFIVGRFHAKVSNCNNFSAIHTKQLLQFQHFHQKMLRAISLLNQRLSCSKGHVN